jgi:WD40 repeat protein
MWKMDIKTNKLDEVFNFHSGRINDMAISDSANFCVSVGQDGNIKFWDYVRRAPIAEKKFGGEGLCVDLMRKSDQNKGRVAAVGYDSGIVRVISVNDRKIELGVVFKAHDAPIKSVRFSPSQSMLVTCSTKGDIFFFEVNGHGDLALYEPICLVKLPDEALVSDLKWDKNSQKVLVSSESGYVYELHKPVKGQVNNKETYLVEDYPYRSWRIKMMEFQKKKN